MPPTGAAPDTVTKPEEVEPPTRVTGFRVTDDKVGSAMMSVATFVMPPAVALMVTLFWADTVEVVMVKDA